MKYETLIKYRSTNKYYDKIYTKLIGLHSRLKEKCYKTGSVKYEIYGGRGVTISEDWKDTTNFMKDVLCLEGFNSLLYLQGKLHLDKDIKVHNSKIYSKETCTWVTNELNEKYKTSRWHDRYAYNYQQNFLYIFNSVTNFLKNKNIGSKYGTESTSKNRPFHTNWIIWDKDNPHSSITEYIYVSPSGIKVRSMNQSLLSRYVKYVSNSVLSHCKTGESRKLQVNRIITAKYNNRLYTFTSLNKCSKYFHVGRDFLTRNLKNMMTFVAKMLTIM